MYSMRRFLPNIRQNLKLMNKWSINSNIIEQKYSRFLSSSSYTFQSDNYDHIFMKLGLFGLFFAVSATPYILTQQEPSDSTKNTKMISEVEEKLNTIRNELENVVREQQSIISQFLKRTGSGQVDVVLGAQWGDEGKGKLVDLLSGKYDLCCRVAGGSNAGHTIVIGNKKYKCHLLPSGVFHSRTVNVIGNGVVIHMPSLLKEIDDLEKEDFDLDNRIWISDRAHLVFDFHQQIDGANETRLGRNKIGTTKKGIGPAYASKINRNGLRVGDLKFFDHFEGRLRSLVATYENMYPDVEIDVEKELNFYRKNRERILKMTTDTILYVNNEVLKGKNILIEGANATMLDIDFGTYPYCTSSNPSIGSVCTGLGVAPNNISEVWGTVKAYCTRVGEGPFPTETLGGEGEKLRLVGAEFGTTTGRPRRCGWLDVPAMKYSAVINGYTALNLTKLDVLSEFDEIKIGVRYILDGKEMDGMPSSLQILERVQVEYETLKGWKTDISNIKNFFDLPREAQRYVLRCEELIGVPIRWIGVGPSRSAIIDRFPDAALP